MSQLKDILQNWRVILLLVFLVLAVVAIRPQFDPAGVAIRSIQVNSSAAHAGMLAPTPSSTPVDRERILSINSKAISSVEEFYQVQETLKPNRTVHIETSKGIYTLTTGEAFTAGSDTSAASDAPATIDLGVRVRDAPASNLRRGLDLEGGTRVVLQPKEKISEDDLELTIANLQQRLNVYGLSDIIVRSAGDLAGNTFIIVEMAGVTEEEVRSLLAQQGKFEAAIGNQTAFFGGKKDITYVCRSADCSGIDPGRGCGSAEGGFACAFFFSISLAPEAAERHAQLTKDLAVLREGSSGYLSEDLVLYMDDVEVDRLRIGAELKGRASTNIQISGSGVGRTEADAVTDALQNMKRLQTILITGSLPVSLEIVKMDTVSPSLGTEFLRNIIFVAMAAVAAVAAVVIFRYRSPKIVIPMVAVMLSELVLILGFAALVGWNMDLASIAGIIIVAGTAVDHLIIITDETLRGETSADWKRRIKSAMAIVLGAYLTSVAGVLPLWFAGAGLLKGFAFTTIAGISFGVFIARPAYAAILEKITRS